jgi:hypothetical protein
MIQGAAAQMFASESLNHFMRSPGPWRGRLSNNSSIMIFRLLALILTKLALHLFAIHSVDQDIGHAILVVYWKTNRSISEFQKFN